MEFSKSCSFYSSVYEHRASDMGLEEFVNGIATGRWAEPTATYRRLAAAGEVERSKRVKNGLPGLVVAGRCEGGHSLKNLKQLSGYAMFDVDHCGDRTEGLLALLAQAEWITAGWRSVSGEGLKAVVRIEACDPPEYARAYAAVARYIGTLAGMGCDMSCRDITRPCFVSHDAEAFFRPDAEVFPWRRLEEEALAPQGEALAPQPKATPPKVPATGILRGFFNDFLARNAFIKGRRNEFLLRLGRVARYRGVSTDELEQLAALAAERLCDGTCSLHDVQARVVAGYRYVDTTQLPAAQPVEQYLQNPSDHQPPMVAPAGEKGGEDAEDEADESYKLLKEVSCFPESVYDGLPDLLLRGLEAAHDRREKDRLLMGMLANLSACLPGVWMNYRDTRCSPHFFFLAVAGAGRGKGVVSLASLLPDAIQQHLDRNDRQLLREFERKWKTWEVEERAALREKRVPNLDLRPEPPVKQMLKVAANTSKSQLIISLEAAGERGVVMNATELDMVSNAVNQDCGKHDDVFRAAFQHEEVGSFFKTDRRMIRSPHPHLALCLSGTLAQLHKFIPSLENGMYSRMSFYMGETAWKWVSAAPREGMAVGSELFEELGEEVLADYLYLSGAPTEVRFSARQWEEHTARFSDALNEVVSEEDDSKGAIVLRHGLVAARIAMVLTALRKCGAKWNTSLYMCTDEDFHAAMDITQVLLEHSLLLSTSIALADKKPSCFSKFYRIRPVLERLGDRFAYREFVSAASAAGIPLTSAKRYFRRLTDTGMLKPDGEYFVKVGKSWQG